jgi:hypothetical protein
MTDSQFNLLLVSLPVIFSAFAAMVVSIITARKVQASSTKIDASAIKIEQTAVKVEETAVKVQEVKEIVDGPLSIALEANARLAELVAQIRGTPEDVRAATEARTLAANRQAGKESPPIK